MTAEEIKKALENKLKENKRIYSMDIAFLKKLLDLIKRYEAENKELKEEITELRQMFDFADSCYIDFCDDVFKNFGIELRKPFKRNGG